PLAAGRPARATLRRPYTATSRMKMKKLCAALIALLPALALADGKLPTPKKLTAAQAKTYREAIAKARKLQVAKDYKGAIKAFEEALSVDPDDAHALGELGYAAYFAKDYKYARESTRKALDR